MSDHQSKNYIDGLIVLALFAIFAVCVICVLLSGAGVYNRVVAKDTSVYNLRTCCNYVATKTRRAENASDVSVVYFGDGDAIRIEETVDGEQYATLVYSYKGWLRELFSGASEDVSPLDGEKLMELSALECSLDGRLLTVSLADREDFRRTMVLYLRGSADGEVAA